MAVISGLSTDTFSFETTGHFLLPVLRWLLPGASPGTLTLLHVGVRKGMHAIEFGILALLWYRALGWNGPSWQTKAALAAFALALGLAVADEAHQMVVPRRTGTLNDVGWDGLGAGLGLIGRRIMWRRADAAREKQLASAEFSGKDGRT